MRKQFLIGLAFAAIAAYSCIPDAGMIELIAVSNAAELAYAPQTSNERQIKVTATLRNIPTGAKTMDFEVSLETHTQSLGDDLAKSSELIANGEKYQPLSWEGSPAGGHHRKGILRFKAVVPLPASVELQIRLAADPSPRSFKWLLK